MRRIAIFASGTGSNFDAIIQAISNREILAEVVLLVCDQNQAKVIQKAQSIGIDVFLFNAKDYPNKESYETEILQKLNDYKVEWLILAGYMRLIGQTLLTAYTNKIINIHPSLLPNYKGKDAIERAFAHGEKTIGVTIHYVDEGMDTGLHIAQESINLTGEESLEEVKAYIHNVEHRLYPKTLALLFKDNEPLS